MRISDWSSGVCSSDLLLPRARRQPHRGGELRVAAMLEPRSRPLFLAPSSTSCSGLTRASRATAQTVALDPRLEAEGDERGGGLRSEEHTSELQSLMRISYAVFCLKKKKNK